MPFTQHIQNHFNTPYPLPLLTSSPLLLTLVNGNSADLAVQVKNSAVILPPPLSYFPQLVGYGFCLRLFLLYCFPPPYSLITACLGSGPNTFCLDFYKERSFRGCRELQSSRVRLIYVQISALPFTS